MGRKIVANEIIYMIVITLAVIWFLRENPAIINWTPADAQTLVDLLPGLLIIGFSIYLLTINQRPVRMGGCIVLGVGLAAFLGAADLQGIITAEMLSGLTVPQLQLWTVIVSTIFGFLLYRL